MPGFFIMSKLKIAITGGIGSGKSSVANVIIKFGYQVIYADDISKEILRTDPAVKEKIIKEFGIEAYKNNEPNKKFLREIIFSDPVKLKKINSILHPPTINFLKKKMEDILTADKMVFVEAALIYEAGIENLFDYIIFVEASNELKISRIKTRDEMDETSIKEIIANQIPDEIKKSHADFTIVNDSTLQELEKRTELVLKILTSISYN